MPHVTSNGQGYVISKLLLDMTKASALAFLQTENAASESDCVMLCAAIYIGHYERRPMTAAKLADFIGMPRPTVVRKLRALKKEGLVRENRQRQWCIDDMRPEFAGRIASAVDALLPLVHRASATLSKMDNGPIAPKQ